LPELDIILKIMVLIVILWSATYVLTGKKKLGNIIYSMRIIAAVLFGILEAVIFYLSRRINNYPPKTFA